MTKYYRVRTQEQWDWLVHRWLDIFQTELQFDRPHIIAFYGGQVYGICDQHKGPEPVIEVSELMEDEKMEEPMTEIVLNDLNEVSHGVRFDEHENKISFIDVPTRLIYPKVEFTKAEEAEFDSIREEETLYNALDVIDHYPALYKRIYEHTSASIPEFELEFARVWADPSLIEVLPEKKWNVLVPRTNNLSYFKVDENQINWGFKDRNNRDDHQFTTEELKHYGLDDDLFEKAEVSE